MASAVELEVGSSLPFVMPEELIEKNSDDVNSSLFSDMKPDDDEDEAHQEQVKDFDESDILKEKGDSNSPMKIVDENVEDKDLSKEQAEGENDGKNELDAGNQQQTLETNHLEKEAELESYLDSLKPKPKKLSLKERLMLMPGYKDLAAIKPKLGGGDAKKNDIIILDEEINKRVKAKEQKRQQAIDLLKERFVRHCIPPPSKSVKGEHVKLKINKKEEDSQGIEHLVENEVDYVRNPLNEEDDAVGFSAPNSVSPKAPAPGQSFRKIQESLLNQIHAKKLKEHEQRVKDYAMYNDENYEDDKEEPEEIIEDEDELSSDEEVEEEEEEELEDLLNGTEKKKKKKKKSVFVDDEAEDEDDNDGDEDDDDDDDDDSSDDDAEDSDSVEDEKKAEAEGKDLGDTVDLANAGNSQNSHHSESDMKIIKRRVINKDIISDDEDENEKQTVTKEKDAENVDDLESIGATEDSLPSVHSFSEKQAEAITTPIKSPDNDSKIKMDFGADFTPKVTSVVLNQITPSDIWVPSKSNLSLRQVDDLIPRINKPEIEPGKRIDPDVPESLANVISEPKARFDDLVDMCSGRFVTQTQANNNSAPSQDEGEFDGFDFGDDDNADVGDCKVGKSNVIDDDEEEVITRIKKIPKQRRLQFSDDEDEGNENEEPEAEDEEVEDISPEISPVKPAANNPFFNKHGLLKRKFVEDEAELSGSEEGSDDEDEKGLNHYEMEEADEEEIDVDAVRTEVERHHLKRMLDEDDRDIRAIQNKFLENGDLHTDRQREKKFKWGLNANDLNDDAQFGDSDDEEQAEETPDETSQKQAWIEKRKWMSENSHLLESGEDESQSLFNSSRFLRISKSTVKKIESYSVTSESEPIKLPSIQRRSIYEEIISNKSMSMMNDSESVSQPLDGEISWTKSTTALKKGSFLSRGGLMLAKLAETSKAGDVVSNVKNNSRNFVFQHITPPNTEKTDGSTSRVKRGTAKAVTKKVKVDRSFHNLDEASKGSSIFKYL